MTSHFVILNVNYVLNGEGGYTIKLKSSCSPLHSMNVVCTDYLGAKVCCNFNRMWLNVCHIIHGSKVF